MTNPFRSVIGLRGVDQTAALWINDLPGMSTELVEDLSVPSDKTEDDDPTGVKSVWERLHRLCYERLIGEIEIAISRDDHFRPVLARTQTPQPVYPTAEMAAASHYTGLVVSCGYMPDSRLILHKMLFLAEMEAPTEADLVVIDLRAKRLLLKESRDIEPGLNTLLLDVSTQLKLMGTPLVFVGIDQRNLPLWELEPVRWQTYARQDEGPYRVQPAAYTLADNRPVLASDVMPTGVFVDATHERTLADVLENYQAELRTAYLYLLGSITLTDKLASPNLTLYTASNRMFTDELENRFLSDARRLLAPVARRMYADLTDSLVDRPDDSDLRYYRGSYV
ncbi:hypothetical protein GCM10023189_43250 [Nibrella saemangeumensis]|uniref:Uncharacterized protein n=1 Tax=Nibrella saemangeumensis TaxID=1084526 RepID=A0ABP8NAT7_9BACT